MCEEGSETAGKVSVLGRVLTLHPYQGKWGDHATTPLSSGEKQKVITTCQLQPLSASSPLILFFSSVKWG